MQHQTTCIVHWQKICSWPSKEPPCFMGGVNISIHNSIISENMLRMEKSQFNMWAIIRNSHIFSRNWWKNRVWRDERLAQSEASNHFLMKVENVEIIRKLKRFTLFNFEFLVIIVFMQFRDKLNSKFFVFFISKNLCFDVYVSFMFNKNPRRKLDENTPLSFLLVLYFLCFSFL